MSLDANHMNRSCRTVMVPRSSKAVLHEYRAAYAAYDGNAEEDVVSTAPVVASWENGVLTTKDERITYTASGDYVFIRYPASLEIRTDVTMTGTTALSSIAVDDYMTTSETVNVSTGKAQFSTALPSSGTDTASGYRYITTNTRYTNANATNDLLNAYGTLEVGDTLHISVNGTTAYNGQSAYALSIDKAPKVTVQDYSGALSGGADQANAGTLSGSTSQNSEETTVKGIKTRQTSVTVPASSIYFDDELTTGEATAYQGKTARVDWDADAGESASKQLWFRFRGTRIDIYCTTDDTSGYVQAAIRDAGGNVVTANGKRLLVTMRCQSDETRYNVPAISFDGLDPTQDYYLSINAIKGANFRLDGIRVYHAADETDAAIQTAYEAAGEQNAKYVNLRGLLLGSVSEETVSGTVAEGAVFYTDNGESALTSDEYKTNGPKNEIYLSTGQSFAFQIVGTYEHVAIGLSAPETQTGGGAVEVTNGSGKQPLTVANALDQYYEVTPAPDGSVIITNTGDALISVTNVKLSGAYIPPADALSLESPLVVSDALMRYAASFRSLPLAEPTPDAPDVPDTPDTPDAHDEPDEPDEPAKESWSTEATDLKSLFRLLLQSLGGLFGGLPGW